MATQRFALRIPRLAKPRFQILLKTLLRLEAVRDDDDGPSGKKLVQQCGEERLGGGSHAGERQCAARLQAPGERLRGGSGQYPVEQAVYRVTLCGWCIGPAWSDAACRRDSGILRQAWERLQPTGIESRQRIVPLAAISEAA